jgi:ATP-dependent Clp protease ATP-binding subunit ClpC
LTVAAAAAFSLAAREAEQLGNASIDIEHLFLGLCRVESLQSWRAADWPTGLGEGQIHDLKKEAEAFTSALGRGGLNVVSARRRMRELWHQANPNTESFSGHRTPRCRQVFAEAESRNGGVIDLAGFMRVILETPSPVLDELLASLMTTRERVISALPSSLDLGTGQSSSLPSKDILSQFGRDLTQLAREGSISRAIGRDEEIKRIARVLLQAKKGNPILVGEAGVGKTAVVEGLALRLVDAHVPAALQGSRLVELSLGSLVAGTKYRGEFEERMQAIIAKCENDRSIILFIDEIHMLLGAGAASSSMDAANLLKPALARGSLRCIGATTVEEYRKHIETDPALERRFQVVWIDEPSPRAAIQILEGLRPTLEKHHGVQISPSAVEKAVELTVRYLPELRLPDKAIDVLDQACARVMLSTFTPRGDSLTKSSQEVGVEEIAAVISERCRVSIHRLTATESELLLRMEKDLGRRIIGQPEAVAAVSRAIRSAKALVRDDRRPVGVFLFLGPTGVGKTELAKAVAEFLFDDDRHLIRIDMSEYAEKHSVAKLIGSPPGYVGHDEGGFLTNRVRSCPYSVVLFDEIEKAHPDVYDLFLQMFDEGYLTDSRGRRASFRDTVIVLTSNVGSGVKQASAKRSIGFVADAAKAAAEALANNGDAADLESQAGRADATWREYEKAYADAVATLLRPEIRNRIHQMIVFRPLAPAALVDIIDQMIERVNGRLASRRVHLALAGGAKDVLIANGYTEESGARSMERAIRSLIEEPIGRMILQGDIHEGQSVCAVGAGGKITFTVS